MIQLTYAAYHTVWIGRELFERVVDRVAKGELPEVAVREVGVEGLVNWVRLDGATPDSCPLKAFWRIVKEGDPEAIRQGKVVLMRLYERFEGQ